MLSGRKSKEVDLSVKQMEGFLNNKLEMIKLKKIDLWARPNLFSILIQLKLPLK